jgi:hypothetical protein
VQVRYAAQFVKVLDGIVSVWTEQFFDGVRTQQPATAFTEQDILDDVSPSGKSSASANLLRFVVDINSMAPWQTNTETVFLYNILFATTRQILDVLKWPEGWAFDTTHNKAKNGLKSGRYSLLALFLSPPVFLLLPLI